MAATPDLIDLLVPAHDKSRTPAERYRLEQAASNALEPVIQGVEAIGELLWRAAAHDGGESSLSQGTLHGLGVLLIHLARFHDLVQFIETNVAYELPRREIER